MKLGILVVYLFGVRTAPLLDIHPKPDRAIYAGSVHDLCERQSACARVP